MSRRAESVDCGCVDGVGFGGGFAFIVVLFILLIIVGASFCGGVAPVAPAYGMVLHLLRLLQPTDVLQLLQPTQALTAKHLMKKPTSLWGGFFVV